MSFSRFDPNVMGVVTLGRWLSSVFRPPPFPPAPPPPPDGLGLVRPPPAKPLPGPFGPVPPPLPLPAGFAVPASLDLMNLPRRLRTLSFVAAVERLSKR